MVKGRGWGRELGAPASCSPNCVSNLSALEGEGISANSGCHLAERRSPQLLLRKCPGYTDKNLTTAVKILCYKPVPVLHCKCTLCKFSVLRVSCGGWRDGAALAVLLLQKINASPLTRGISPCARLSRLFINGGAA